MLKAGCNTPRNARQTLRHGSSSPKDAVQASSHWQKKWNKEMLKGATGSNTQRDCVQASRHREKQWFAYHVWLSSQKKYTNA